MPRSSAPLSPHLQIYRPQWTSVLSILHRLTGCALTVGLPFLAWFLWAIAAGPDAFQTMMIFWASPFGIFMLMGWTFALSFHLCSGIRHFIFDLGRLMAVEKAERAGKVVLRAAILLTLMLWLIGLMEIML